MSQEENKTAVNGEDLLQWFEETMQTMNENPDKQVSMLENNCSLESNQATFKVEPMSDINFPNKEAIDETADTCQSIGASNNHENIKREIIPANYIAEELAEENEVDKSSIALPDLKLPEKENNEITQSKITMESFSNEDNQNADTGTLENLDETKKSQEIRSEKNIEPITTNEKTRDSENWPDTFAPTMFQAVSSSLTQAVKDPESMSTDTGSGSDDDSSDDDSSSDSSSSDDDDSSDDELIIDETPRMVTQVSDRVKTPAIKKSLILENVLAASKVEVPIPSDITLEPIGKISNFIENSVVVVKSLPMKPALNFDSVLFLADKSVLGKVQDTFGPVVSPFYVVCFEEGSVPQDLKLDQEIYFAPKLDGLTNFVFLSQLKSLKGSDASWFNDQEPPDNMLDYSDDEQERAAKGKSKQAKLQRKIANQTTNSGSPQISPNTTSQRGRGRAVWSNRSVRYANPVKVEEDVQSAWMNACSGISNRRNVNNNIRFCPGGAQRMPPPPQQYCNPQMHCPQRTPPVPYPPPHTPPMQIMNFPPPPTGISPFFNHPAVSNNLPIPPRPSHPPPSTSEAHRPPLPFVRMPSCFSPPPPPPPPPPPSDISDATLPDMTMLFNNPPTVGKFGFP